MWIGPARSPERKAANVSLLGSMCPIMRCTLSRSDRIEDSMTLVTRLLPVPKSWQEFCPNAIGNAPCVAGVVRGIGAVIEPARRSHVARPLDTDGSVCATTNLDRLFP